MVRRSLGSGMVSLAVFQNDLPSRGMSESSMAESRIWRRRLKSVLPGALEVVRVGLPFITMCPPGGNNPPLFAAHHVHRYDFNAFHRTDGDDAFFLSRAGLDGSRSRTPARQKPVWHPGNRCDVLRGSSASYSRPTRKASP